MFPISSWAHMHLVKYKQMKEISKIGWGQLGNENTLFLDKKILLNAYLTAYKTESPDPAAALEF